MPTGDEKTKTTYDYIFRVPYNIRSQWSWAVKLSTGKCYDVVHSKQTEATNVSSPYKFKRRTNTVLFERGKILVIFKHTQIFMMTDINSTKHEEQIVSLNSNRIET